MVLATKSILVEERYEPWLIQIARHVSQGTGRHIVARQARSGSLSARARTAGRSLAHIMATGGRRAVLFASDVIQQLWWEAECSR